MKITLEDCVELSPGIWRTCLGDRGLDVLGRPEHAEGSRSVVLLNEKPVFTQERSLTFPLSAARVVNRGSADEVLLVATTPDGGPAPPRSLNGDQEFLKNLPSYLYDVGSELLNRIRSEFPGELRFHPRSKKFVESPDNFFTIRIQPHDRSLRITVRGLPQKFRKPRSLELKQDMTSYSAFKIASADEIHEAIEILRQADRKTRA
jgi:hypothetical protein